jgi:hypothetical protein
MSRGVNRSGLLVNKWLFLGICWGSYEENLKEFKLKIKWLFKKKKFKLIDTFDGAWCLSRIFLYMERLYCPENRPRENKFPPWRKRSSRDFLLPSRIYRKSNWFKISLAEKFFDQPFPFGYLGRKRAPCSSAKKKLMRYLARVTHFYICRMVHAVDSRENRRPLFSWNLMKLEVSTNADVQTSAKSCHEKASTN